MRLSLALVLILSTLSFGAAAQESGEAEFSSTSGHISKDTFLRDRAMADKSKVERLADLLLPESTKAEKQPVQDQTAGSH